MMHEVHHMLQSNGIDIDRIHKESFYLTHKSSAVDAAVSNTEEALSSKKVILKLDGKQHEVEVSNGRYILESALEAGLDLPYACTMGVCGMCRAYKVQGEMIIEEQEAISDSEIRDGACLTCVGKPISDNLIIDYDRY
jgi:ring-1,2-phenylacetyl-CoA epoxidase subunit PaaE